MHRTLNGRGIGGVHGADALALGLGALVIPEQISIPRAADTSFDEHGHLLDKGLQEGFKALIQRLAVVASAMTAER